MDGEGNLGGDAANRLLAAIQLQRRLNIPVLVSGGQVFADSGAEALIAKRILQQAGIVESKIIAETQSLNTTQNAAFTKKLLQQGAFTRPILVTSAYHMERSVRNFAKQGITVVPYPTDYHSSAQIAFRLNNFVPSAGALFNTALVLKEYLGILALVLW